MKIVGIDFSMNSPGICIHEGETWNHQNCRYAFLTPKKSLLARFPAEHPTIVGLPLSESTVDTVRWNENASTIFDFIFPIWGAKVAVEGYAFGVKSSRVFSIGEATGALKSKVFFGDMRLGISSADDFDVYPPREVKKFATGSGNADKDVMYSSFIAETGYDFRVFFGYKPDQKLASPVHDLVDAYYIAKLAHTKSNT